MSRKKQKKNKISRKNESLVAHFHLYYRIREASLLLTVALALFLLIALFSYHRNDPSWSHLVSDNHVANAGGRIGAWLSDFLLYIFGYGAYLFPMLLTYAAWIYYQHRHREHDESVHVWVMLTVRFIGFVLILLTFAALLALYVSTPITALPYNAGGILGALIGNGLWQAFGIPGATLMLITIFLIGFTLFTGISWLKTSEKTGVMVVRYLAVACRLIKKIPWLHFFRRNRAPSFDDPFDKPRSNVRQEEPMRAAQQEALPLTKPRIVRHKTADLELDTETLHRAPHFTASDIIPELTLLDPPPEAHPLTYDDEQLAARSREVEMRLVDFGIKAKVVAVHPGPVVTRYELQLAAGTKVSKITALVKDLARSLSVISVRVVEVIPGKSVIGLELPNEHRQVVSLREVLATKVYQNARSPLTLALGKDIAGHPVVVDLAKMPHLLVAGTTGSGKSVSLNTMLLSLLYKASPSKLRLILIDPKMLELAVYEGIPHLLAPVVTDMKDAATALRWCVVEMERRYRLMAALGVRNILGYNQKVKEAKQRGAPLLDPLQDKESQSELEELPRIVVLADEFADMMVVVGKKVETLISRLAQKARAAGIHLIFATQRPSVDVITGLIKANIPTRIAFQVSSKIDSRTVLDQQGAEQLLGNGDMLYLPPGSGLPVRVHGAFVHDEEVHRVVEYLKEHGETNYIDNLLDESAGVDTSGFTQAALGDAEVDGEKDPLYDEAVDIVIKAQRVSISSIQRRFKIGYNRAARIVEAMEAAGVVSAMESNGNRDVLVPRSREE